MRAQVRGALVILLALAAAVLAHAHQVNFKARVDLVRVDVLVTDQGRPISGLTRSDFEVRDNGRVQEIDAVFGAAQPLEVVLVLDVSASLQGQGFDHLKQAAWAAVEGLQAGDHIRLLTFSHRITLGAAAAVDAAAIRTAIERLDASGNTSMCDALYSALTMAEGGPRRTVVLLFSDGRDNRSWLSAEAVVQVARESDTVVYAVAYKPPWRSSSDVVGPDTASGPDKDLLTKLANDTGGRLIWEDDSSRLPGVFQRLLAEMRSRYLLTYYPHDVSRSGWHALSVRLKDRIGKVVARPGYMVR
jgi:VWFA-related protein